MSCGQRRHTGPSPPPPPAPSPVPRYLQRGGAEEGAGVGHDVRHARHVGAPHCAQPAAVPGAMHAGRCSPRGAGRERQPRVTASGRRSQVTGSVSHDGGRRSRKREWSGRR